jgi:hypothetical protein
MAMTDELGSSGDWTAETLRQHLELALISAEKLEVTRIDEVRSLTVAVQREITIAFAASEKAIEKQERNAAEWRAGANEWRQQSADRERSQAEEMARLTASFIRVDTADAQFVGLREYIDSQFSEIRRQMAELTDKIGKLV